MSGRFLHSNTEVRIGNEGYPTFFVTPKNQELIKKALKEFTDKMFDSPCVHYYVKVNEADCILDSVELLGCAIWAGMRHYVPEEIYDKNDSALEDALRRGKLFLGCDYEFDTGKDVDPGYLGLEKTKMESMCVSDQLSSITFRMFYYYGSFTPGNLAFRRTIFRLS
jgi:hypothetical protein